jgi:hypothetical protein
MALTISPAKPQSASGANSGFGKLALEYEFCEFCEAGEASPGVHLVALFKAYRREMGDW